MPSNRPRPIRLNAAPRAKGRSTKTKAPAATAPQKPRRDKATSILSWTAAGLAGLLVALIIVYINIPNLKAWMARDRPSENPDATWVAPSPVPPPAAAQPLPPIVQTPPPPPSKPPPAIVPPKPKVDDQVVKTLKERADEETRHLIERPVPAPAQVTPPPVPPVAAEVPPSPPPPPEIVAPKAKPVTTAPAMSEAVPPVAQPISAEKTGEATARALPVDLGKLDTTRVAGYQVALERMHFSCGFIDGDQGMRTQRMLRAFQSNRGLPVTGTLDPATREAIGEPVEPFFTYTVTHDDVASIMPKPATWKEKSQAKRLGYNTIWELLAEKFHCTRAYLKALNKEVTDPMAGSEIVAPKISPAAPLPKIASLRISLSDTTLEGLDASGKIVAFFPCSIAKDKNKRPSGRLTVITTDPNPDYTFDPALFADAAKAEGISKKMTIPPGPRNPVGTDWVGLSLPGYGIHGTPEPENISRTQSHGCFRLANWNAEKVLKMVRIGTPVDVEP